ncbi:PD-(D/E)XK motif protein [Serpentinicella alkaliphila]|uniref:Putative PD-(D/E)XK family protein DUF4420 n=1 Tax=Serpentinicella alkaliphila TaxID=1734049 RepID=A0A4V2T2L0_9FIRM|nr:PD-(D/E)XK motif protein [Serpentinicella alkaliphila]QUH26419.1 PD-(D/E)XK motif protein [Serpentinicella alkaliphila]TCP97843.1 putative PD-(D/E)XK family protein DUF4420 [Serpentinicella alkaliphila]
MINNTNPWIKMSVSSLRRIDAKVNHNIFWIKDFYGNYGFCIHSKIGFNIDENTIKLRGISISKRNSNSNNGIVELYLILNNYEEWEIFLTLCEDLVAVTKKYISDELMIHAVENRLRRWQQLLKMQINRSLTLEKQMGLFSELLCLRDFVCKKVGIKQAITSWVGPEYDKQDFLLDDMVIEVKSYRSSKGEFAHISSLHQLNSEKEPLYLFTYSLTTSENGLTVENVIESIRLVLKNESNETINMFEDRLIEYGYVPELNNEPLKKFILDKLKVFCVMPCFPKISSNVVSSHIVSVKYTIDLTKCNEFEINIGSLL